jgi:ArsR family transcriptional regulator, arsenate/arsenite/antimonite-responsive transcriptional repressor
VLFGAFPDASGIARLLLGLLPTTLGLERTMQKVVGLDSHPYFHIGGDMEKIYAIAALAALAQETRLDIFRLLVQAGEEGMPAGHIGERLGLPSATLSFHLNQLKHANLVTFRRESRSLIYKAAYPVMNDLLAYLTENCCQGNAAACGLPSCAPTTETPAIEEKRHEASARARIRR